MSSRFFRPTWTSVKSQTRRRSVWRSYRPSFELLEDRVVPAGHLAVALTGATSAHAGDTVQFSAVATNNGNADLTNVDLVINTDRAFLSWSATGSANAQVGTSPDQLQASATIGDLAPGGQISLTVSAGIRSDQGGKIYHITSSEAQGLTLTVHGAHLVLSMTASAPFSTKTGTFPTIQVQNGTFVTYTETYVTNQGPDPAPDVRLLTIPDFESPLAFQGATLNGQPVANPFDAKGIVDIHLGDFGVGPPPGPEVVTVTYQIVGTSVLAFDVNGLLSLGPNNANFAGFDWNKDTSVLALPDRFVLAAPANITPGQPFDLTVAVANPQGAPDPTYRDEVRLTSSDASASLPAAYTFTAADNGVHTFHNVILNAPGSQTLFATSQLLGPNPPSTADGATTVNVAAPGRLQLTLSNTRAGVGLGILANVTVFDANNQVMTNFRGTVQFASSSAAGLPADYTFTAADAGSHTFSNVTLNVIGNQTVSVSGGNPGGAFQADAKTVSVADATSDQLIVQQYYADLLGRAVDPGGLGYWTTSLLQNGAFSSLASALDNSGEYRSTLISGFYGTLLGRAADPGGLNFGLSLLAAGQTVQQVEAGLLGSDEYFQKQGSTNNGFLTGLYRDALGRALDNGGLSYWSGILAQSSRQQVALTILGTQEALGLLINATYQQYLRRAPDAGGLTFFEGALAGGTRYEALVTTLLTSSEYLVNQAADTQPPAIVLVSPGPDTVVGGNFTITGHANDAKSGVATFSAQQDSGPFNAVPIDGAGNFSFTTTLPTDGSDDGSHQVMFAATDKVGNQAALVGVPFTLVTVPPAIPELKLAPGSDSGASSTDLITNVKTPTVIATTDAGATVHLSVDGQPAGTATAINGAANFTIGPLADGQHTITATATNGVGNASGTSVPLPITIETTPPAIPVFDLAPGSDSGTQGDHTTSQATVSLLGTSTDGARIDLVQTGDSTTTESGAFDLANVALRPGANTLTARATDIAGNQSTFTLVITRIAAASAPSDAVLQAFDDVHNSIVFTPYNGLQKGAQGTEESGSGNDWDQAALLIAKLQALSISAAYLTGTISVPAAMVEAWLGVENETAALQVLADSGASPNESATVPGNIEFTHTWVDATVPQTDGGSINFQLDPSWKFRAIRLGVTGVLAKVPFDMNGYLSQVELESASEYYQAQVAAYLKANAPSLSLADVPHDGPILVTYPSSLPNALPYLVVGAPVELGSVPEALTQRAVLELEAGAQTLFTQQVALPDVALERITIGSVSLGGGQVQPELLIDGQVVATGGSVADGSPLTLQVQSMEPGGDIVNHTWTSTITAGDYAAVGLDVNQFSMAGLARVQAALNATAFTALAGASVTPDDQIGGFLELGVDTWFFNYDHGRDTLNGLTGALADQQQLEFGVTTSQTTVSYDSVLQISYVPADAAIDIAGLVQDSTPIDGDTSQTAARTHLIGLNGSSLESSLWEQLINTPSISTAKSLEIAATSGIPIFTINAGNQSTFLPQLTLDPTDVADITAAVNAGATVTTPRDPTPLRNWQGVGYIADYGASAVYLISGGLGSREDTVSNGGQVSGAPVAPVETPKGTPDKNQFFCPVSQATATQDPVDSANGNVVRDETDVQLPGIGLGLSFARHYDSQSTLDIGMGTGWLFTYGDFLTFNNDQSITWTTPQGYQYTFTPVNGGYTAPEILFGTFTAISGGYHYRDKDGTITTFDSQGRLTEVRDRNNNALAITHVGATNQLSTVTEEDAPSHFLTFGYTGAHLTSVADATGRTWTYGYNGAFLANVTTPSDANAAAATTSYSYFSDTGRAGLLHQITVPDGGTLTYDYYPNGRAFQGTDPAGNTNTFWFNLYRQATTHVDPDGGADVHTYNAVGNNTGTTQEDGTSNTNVWVNSLLISQTDPMGNTTSYTYDTHGNVIKTIDPTGAETDFTYDSFGDVTSVTQPGGRVTHYIYDANGNLTSQTDAMGDKTSFTYDPHGQVASKTLPDGNAGLGNYTTTFTYNDVGRVTQQVTGLPSTVSFAYDARGNLVSKTDADNHTTTYTYDVRDRLLTVVDPLQHVTTYAHDVMSNLTSFTDVMGRTTAYKYDALERCTQIIEPSQASLSFAYDASNDLTSSTDELGNTINHVFSGFFDDQNREIQTIFADGTSQEMAYDAAGRETSLTDESGNVEVFTYDGDGRKLTDTHLQADGSVGSTITTKYDAVGNITATIDALNHTTSFSYDLANRLTSETDPNSGVTQYTYDPDGNTTSVTDPDGNKTAYAFDVLDRQVSMTDQNHATASQTYDAAGNVISSVDRDSRTINYQYDALNRLLQETWLDSANHVIYTVTFTRDARGEITGAADNNSSSSMLFDNKGETTSVTTTGAGQPTVAVAYLYDLAGNVVAVTDSVNGAQEALTAYTYDSRNRIVRAIQTGPTLADTRVDETYTPTGNVATIARFADVAGAQAVAQTTISYDFMDRQTGISTTANGSVATAETVTYDAASQVTQIQADGITSAYTYDNNDQLLTAVYSGTTQANESYTYDKNGNRATSGGKTTVVGPANELTNDGTYSYTYDAEGNVVKQTTLVTGTYQVFAWDYHNRLTSVTSFSAGGQQTGQVTYTYDVFGRRLTETTQSGSGPASTTEFVYDRTNVIADLSIPSAGSTPTLTNHYLRGAVDQLFAQTSPSTGTLWTIQNHEQSTVALVNNAGAVVNRIHYDAFGNVVSQDPSQLSTRYLYAGMQFDAAQGAYFARTRYFDAVAGRFLTQDPIQFLGDPTNAYRYVGNHPTNATDTSGLFGVELGDPVTIGGVVTALIGGAFCAAEIYVVGIPVAVIGGGVAIYSAVTTTVLPPAALTGEKNALLLKGLIEIDKDGKVVRTKLDPETAVSSQYPPWAVTDFVEKYNKAKCDQDKANAKSK